jgi:hypothetical protein
MEFARGDGVAGQEIVGPCDQTGRDREGATVLGGAINAQFGGMGELEVWCREMGRSDFDFCINGGRKLKHGVAGR